jgi:hypothetical protein
LAVLFLYAGFICTTQPGLQGIVQKMTETKYMCNQCWGENTSFAVGAIATEERKYSLSKLYTFCIMIIILRGNQFCVHVLIKGLLYCFLLASFLFLSLDHWKCCT